MMKPWQDPLNKATSKGGKQEQKERERTQVHSFHWGIGLIMYGYISPDQSPSQYQISQIG
jgi:hypothetical protein